MLDAILFWYALLAFMTVVVVTLGLGVGARRIRSLTELAEPDGVESWPRVSVIVAARNEGRHIATSVESLLKLDYEPPRDHGRQRSFDGPHRRDSGRIGRPASPAERRPLDRVARGFAGEEPRAAIWRRPLVGRAPTGQMRDGLPVLNRRPAGEIDRVLARGFPGRLLRLYALEQEYLRQEMGSAHEPAYLLLSDQQGGFPRFGFVLDGARKPDAGYVDLHHRSMVAGRFGAMDQIFPHDSCTSSPGSSQASLAKAAPTRCMPSACARTRSWRSRRDSPSTPRS